MDLLGTRRMEHGIPLLADFDLGALVGVQEKLQDKEGEDNGPEQQAAMAEALRALGVAGKARSVRRLSAVVRATEEQLRDAELTPAVMEALEEEAALRPYSESFLDAVSFFAAWGNSFKVGPASSAPATTKALRLRKK